MPRRNLTLLLAGGLAVLLLGLASSFKVPYVELSPGPAYDTLHFRTDAGDVLSISGARTYPADGSLDLTTVSVRDQLSMWEALRGWVSGRDAVVPREFIFPPDQSAAQTEKQNEADMKESQDDATTAALSELGLATVLVADVTKGGRSDGKLLPGDAITSIDGTRVTGTGLLRSLVRKHAIGEAVQVGFVRAGRPGTVTITTGPSLDKPSKAALGITTKITSHIKVTIRLQDVGGPSAGLMFALGIIDKLEPGSLTGGRRVAGTGTINPDGSVGAIGGIGEKMLGARDSHATVFLSPAANCAEAKSAKPAGLTLVRVATLHEALTALAELRAGRTPPSC